MAWWCGMARGSDCSTENRSHATIWLPDAGALRIGDAEAAYVCPCHVRRFRFYRFGRGDWIRTSDLLNPIQVRYQTALRPGC